MILKDGHIILYGVDSCSKTRHYKQLLDGLGLSYSYRDVAQSDAAANELINLYRTRKLNFPTIMLGTKKLRNPSDFQLKTWLLKLQYIVNDIDK
ncbi:MAG: glutaredoxin family protein [Flavobacteriales bacterium]|nr:glutaredoxin family protein [Flavobacteriales bacterium]